MLKIAVETKSLARPVKMLSSRVLGLFILMLTMVAAVFYLFPTESSLLNFDEDQLETQATFSPAENYNLSIFSPIPKTLNVNPDEAALGQKLFFDPALSQNGKVACASCHSLGLGGADGKPIACGIDQHKGVFNTPTVFNATFNFSLNWEGSAASLKEQALGPLFDPREMGNRDEKTLVNRLQNLPHYAKAFNEVYQSKVTLSNITGAIEAFQKTLITPDSNFDLYLKGDYQALDTTELEGLQLFKNLGCVSCHNGINIGGNMYQTAGIFIPIATKEQTSAWPDRYNVTQEESDRNMVKVPSLRNIEMTAPYFHDGKVSSLKQAIKIMGKAQLGKNLSKEQIYKLESFLKTLTGKYLNRSLASSAFAVKDSLNSAHQSNKTQESP